MRVEGQQADFKLKDGRVGGQGLQTEFRDADWSHIRKAVYEGRGS